nr:unnamed protein product [Callosobruchus chinensis]
MKAFKTIAKNEGHLKSSPTASNQFTDLSSCNTALPSSHIVSASSTRAEVRLPISVSKNFQLYLFKFEPSTNTATKSTSIVVFSIVSTSSTLLTVFLSDRYKTTPNPDITPKPKNRHVITGSPWRDTEQSVKHNLRKSQTQLVHICSGENHIEGFSITDTVREKTVIACESLRLLLDIEIENFIFHASLNANVATKPIKVSLSNVFCISDSFTHSQ